MAAQKIQQPVVNLLPKDPFTVSVVGKVLNWSLSTGRYIVIFTEMIVIITFLSRFTLDRQVTDLTENILKKQALIQSYEQVENTVRGIQRKAEFLAAKDQEIKSSDTLDFISEKVPADVILDSLNFSKTEVNLTGTAFSQDSLSLFVQAVKRQPQMGEVSLNSVAQVEKSQGITFRLQAQFK